MVITLPPFRKLHLYTIVEPAGNYVIYSLAVIVFLKIVKYTTAEETAVGTYQSHL